MWMSPEWSLWDNLKLSHDGPVMDVHTVDTACESFITGYAMVYFLLLFTTHFGNIAKIRVWLCDQDCIIVFLFSKTFNPTSLFYLYSDNPL